MQPDGFVNQVADAYLHIYDLVYLRTHALTDLVTPQAGVPRKKKAWLLHDVLLGLIDELDPGYQAPEDGREKRRHRLLALRYAEGLASKAVADALAISQRHYYREHDSALEAVASILWQRYGGAAAAPPTGNTDIGNTEAGDADPGLATRQALLRAEVAQFHDFAQAARLDEVLAGVIDLARELTRAQGLRLTLELPPAAPPLPLDRTLLRQLLLGVLSYLGEQLATGEIQVRVQLEEEQQTVELVAVRGAVSGDGAPPDLAAARRGEPLATLYELAGLQGVALEPLDAAAGGFGYRLRLPSVPRRTILLVDDNGDMLALYQRYLQQAAYQTVAVQSGREALRLASRLRPRAIVLDLMLPEQDGWEILQRLTNHPETQAIPVVICSILRARPLALALGAAAFLEKPVDERELLAVLAALPAG
ncbi:MAG: hypothetical protein DCC57_16680 [Chloroflexi bacterium]|nr:MAG: hypothetical protein DCC57_16680 [Chloroflexota bacterium]